MSPESDNDAGLEALASTRGIFRLSKSLLRYMHNCELLAYSCSSLRTKLQSLWFQRAILHPAQTRRPPANLHDWPFVTGPFSLFSLSIIHPVKRTNDGKLLRSRSISL
jgi:hypothetical protein